MVNSNVQFTFKLRINWTNYYSSVAYRAWYNINIDFDVIILVTKGNRRSKLQNVDKPDKVNHL